MSTLEKIADLNRPDLRVSCQVRVSTGWNTKQRRDTYQGLVVWVHMSKPGVGPVYSEHVEGKNLTALCEKAYERATAAIAQMDKPTPPKRKLKLKR